MAKKSAECIAPTGARRTRFREAPAYQEGLWDLGNELYAWMVPNGSWGESNSGLVVGNTHSLLIDTLWDLKHTQTMLDAMDPLLRNAPLELLVNTHADGDHFWGNELLDNIDSITSAAARAEMDHHKPGTMLAFEKLGRVLKHVPLGHARQVGHWFSAMCLPYAFNQVTHTPAAQTFTGTIWKEVGGRRVQLIEVGPAHTTGDLMVHVPEARTLFTGDILFIGSTPVMWAGPVENWLRALDLILDLQVDTIIPGHGPITNKDGVRDVKVYLEFVRDAARNCYEDKMSAKIAAHHIVSSDEFRAMPHSEWDSPERMMTNVHFLYRHFKGRTGPLSVPHKINLMRQQAMLAHTLPDAAPAVMRQSDASW